MKPEKKKKQYENIFLKLDEKSSLCVLLNFASLHKVQSPIKEFFFSKNLLLKQTFCFFRKIFSKKNCFLTLNPLKKKSLNRGKIP